MNAHACSPQLTSLLERLVEKLRSDERSRYMDYKKVTTHALPLTNLGKILALVGGTTLASLSEC